MGSSLSKNLDEWSEISVRRQDNPNDRWIRIFRYGGGGLAVSSAFASYLLLLKWLNEKKVGGLEWRHPDGRLTKGYLNLHILLMGTSFLLLMSPSIITFEVLPRERHDNKDLHNILNSLSLVSGLAGLGIAIDCNRNLSKGGSMRSVHGVVGYLTMALLLSNWLGGFLMYVRGLGGPMRGSLKPLHKRLGMLTIIMGLCNITLGLMRKQGAARYTPQLQALTHRIAALTMFTLIGVYSCVSKFEDKSDPK